MSEPIKVDLGATDEGMIEFTMLGVTQRLDIFDVHNRMISLRESMSTESADKANDAIAVFIEGLGFPKPSHRLALQFEAAKDKLVLEFQKKDGLATGKPAESPDSTALIRPDGD